MYRGLGAALAAAALVVLPAAPVGSARPSIPDPQRIEGLREQERAVAPKVAAARARLDAAVAAYERARGDLELVARRVEAAEAHLAEVSERLREARDQLNARAVSVYRRGRVGLFEALLSVRSFSEFVRASALTGTVLRHDADLVERVEALRVEADGARAEVAAEAREHETRVSDLASKQDALMRQMRTVANLLERIREDLGAELGKFRFPVKPPYSYVDTFGAPRMTGTKWAHDHEGIDVFALRGTPVVAVVTGTVQNVGQAPLGGNKLWLRGPDGHNYYYAHLDGFAPAARSSRRVEAGTVLGYVGDTGNAKGTPPHLHFEIHAPGGAVLNPYSTLREAERVWARL